MKRTILGLSLLLTALLGSEPVKGGGLVDTAEAESDASSWEAFPGRLLDAPYLADPLQPRFGATVVSVPDLSVSDTGDRRFGLHLGGRFGLVEHRRPERPEGAWQLSIEGGFYGQFDMDNNQDNVGWDGIYGLYVGKQLGRGMTLKLGAKHVSSHIGDELQERTSRQRIEYTREEAIIGLSRRWPAGWRGYVEAAWGYVLRTPELQDPGRLQAGLERRSAEPVFGRYGWYAAINLTSFEESDWSLDTTAHVGLAISSGGVREWRFGLAYHDGRVPLGEFFQDRERYVVLGFWLDP